MVSFLYFPGIQPFNKIDLFLWIAAHLVLLNLLRNHSKITWAILYINYAIDKLICEIFVKSMIKIFVMFRCYDIFKTLLQLIDNPSRVLQKHSC